ncbi:BTAD domain-containing putative transcriptional regulator [Kribbella sp. NPDC051952]|uniref:AfsR/SARP family transcriptional regulator n=1 Tax=Kribbella sp. NPDC051952 TaxID=3154851 RepID=UPI00341D1420
MTAALPMEMALHRSGAAPAVPRTEVRLLGGFEIIHNAQVLDLKPGTERLVAFLALLERAVERRYAAFRLWPDKGENRAMANLRSALWRLRPLPVTLVEATSTHVRLRRDVWVDARHGLADAELSILDDLGLTGELLPDWYDDWLVVERERLRQQLLHMLETACECALHAERYGHAIDVGLRAIALEPLRESAHRLVIRAHLGESNIHEAQRQYRQFADLLRGELGLIPSPGLQALVSDPG